MSKSTGQTGFDPRRLIQAQRLACISRRDLAARVGVDPLAIQSWLGGISEPRRDQLARLSKALGYPPAFFRYGRPMFQVDPMAMHWCPPSPAAPFAGSEAI